MICAIDPQIKCLPPANWQSLPLIKPCDCFGKEGFRSYIAAESLIREKTAIMSLQYPTITDIYAARKHVYQYVTPTPLHYYADLSRLAGCDIWVKHENHHAVGAFKVRGGLVLAAGLSAGERQAGLFTASTGNHGQSIAFAAKVHGIKARIAVPEKANPGKVSAMRSLDAEVIHHGKNFDEAREWIRQQAEESGGCFIGPTEESLIAGVGTYVLEIFETLPDPDYIIVPVGGGSSVCAASIVAHAINPETKVIGAQSSGAPAAQQSWKAGKPIEVAPNTFAEGVATGVPFENTQRIMRKYLNDFLLVDDAEIEAAIIHLLHLTHTLSEGAGAIPLATALRYRERFRGKKVVLVLSGGNLSVAKLRRILDRHRQQQ